MPRTMNTSPETDSPRESASRLGRAGAAVSVAGALVNLLS